MTKNKEKIARVVVWITIVGLVGAYIPLLFTPPDTEENIPQPASQQVTVPLIPENPVSTSTSSSTTTLVP